MQMLMQFLARAVSGIAFIIRNSEMPLEIKGSQIVTRSKRVRVVARWRSFGA